MLELIEATRPRYERSSRADKGRILDQFSELSGLSRKRAGSILLHPPKAVLKLTRSRKPIYDEAVRQVLVVLWEAADRVCGKRLRALIPLLLQSLEQHGHLNLEPIVRERLMAISPATIDRLLAPPRKEIRSKTPRRVRAKYRVRNQIPVKTFADWHEPEPGFMEVDCVAHCGGNLSGSFIHSFVMTDVASGWTECIPLVAKTGALVIEAIKTIRARLPFPLRGINVDNGCEFVNDPLAEFCKESQITFTRGRPRQSNDQAWIEQKNNSVVRRFLGYERFSGLPMAKAIARLYVATRVYVNCFQPSFKLDTKTRVGAKVKKQYHPPATPCNRLLTSVHVCEFAKDHLRALVSKLDPLRLLEEIRTMQDHIARLAKGQVAPIPPHRDPDLDLFLRSLKMAWKEGEVRATHKKSEDRHRRYWRARKDPFEEAWPTLLTWLDERPDITAVDLFHQLQAACSGSFPDNQLRTLQRRVKEWRSAEARRLLLAGSVEVPASDEPD
jgi:hypothetical protein